MDRKVDRSSCNDALVNYNPDPQTPVDSGDFTEK